jgi:threonine synthase
MVIEGRDVVQPIKHPRTVVKSLAIGDPADAVYARAAMLESGGFAAAPSDEEILEGVRLLAESEGVFAETAGGVVVAAARRLVAQGKIGKDDGAVVLSITGQGLKTQDPLVERLPRPELIGPRLAEFDGLLGGPLRSLL